MTHTTKTTTPTSTRFTLPAILPTILTGLFILTACGGGALPNDGSVAPDTQNNACADNPLAEGCQAGAGFLSVNLDEDIVNQEAEPSVAPPTPEPVVNTPVVKKTEPVLEELAKKKTQPTPAPITSVDTSDFVPKTSPSTQSAPAEQRSGSAVSGDSGASGQQSAPVRAADTTAFTALPTEREVATPNQFGVIPNLNNLSNQFLEADDDTGLDRLGAVRADPLRMNLAQATYDGVAIGGQAADGIDFFTADLQQSTFKNNGTINTISHSRFHYAGILAGTDLGVPVSSDVGTATWNGSFRTYNTNPVDFQLEVTFGGEGGRTISAFVKDGARRDDYYYLLAGTYTDAGLITGTVNWGTFSDIALRTPTDGETPGTARATNGTLMGLIGVEGAVGVFISDVAGSTVRDDAVHVTTFIDGYAGGFVAAPSDRATGNPDVTFSDWTRAIPSVTGGNNGFEAGGVNGLAQTAITNVINLADCEAHNAQTVIDTITYTHHRPDPNAVISSTNQVTHVTSVVTRKPKFDQLDCTGNHSGSLNLAGARFEEVTDSGVAFVTDGISRTTLTSGQSFAGLLSGTDLGAPISDVSQVGEWKGKFKSVGGYYIGGATRDDQYISTAVVDTDFTLTVTFGAVGGVDGSAGSIEAFVATSGISRHFLLKGTYDANGVITGTVLAGLFDNNERSNPSATINGVLTGLIGVEGAVGAFVSNANNYNYAGGFVASPLIPDVEHEVVFADWTRSFATEPALAPTTGTPQSEFLQTTGSTLATGTLTALGGGAITVTTLDLNTATLRNNPLGGDAKNGVAFYRGYDSGNSAGYAGIFSTTDLGGPITAKDAKAEWRGQFQVVQSRIINTDFTLEVTFGAVAGVDGSVGKVEAFVEQIAPNVAHHYVRGTFNAAGVIKGTAIAGGFTNGDRNQFNGGATDGILTGLIGEDGAVGAFYSQAGVYAGGFVALPLSPVRIGTPGFWARNALTTTAGVYPTILSPGTATLTKTGNEPNDDPQANFMQAGASALNLGADARADVTIATNYNVNLSQLFDSNDATSGFTLAHAHSTADATQFNLYVGLLSGTDVGAPFTNANMPYASWTGRLRLESPQAQISFNEEVRFTVGFDGTDGTIITDAIALGAGRQTTNNITINGQFGADGVIFGTTTADLGTGSANVSATLSGLIGVDGAVAVFAGNDASTDGSYAGGFVARPTFTVNYDGWLDSFSETLPTEGHPSDGNDSEFLQSGPIKLDTGTITGPFGALVTNLTLTMDDNTNNGVSFFSGTYVSPRGVENINRHRFYAGILSGTNVGEPLAPYTSGDTAFAMWNGKLQSVNFVKGGGRLVGREEIIPMKLRVNFDMSTIEAFVKLMPDNATDHHHLLLEAGYNERGQFTNGTVKYGVFPGSVKTATRTDPDGLGNQRPLDGKLTGIIGQEGAVGVFINDIVPEYGFAGGFWAAPN